MTNGKSGFAWRTRTAKRWYKKNKTTVVPASINKVKMQRPTAKNQQKQIIKNSTAITKMLKVYNKNIVFTDYQLSSTEVCNRDAWLSIPLTTVEFWQPVMRKSVAIENTKTTTCVRMNLKIRYDMGQIISSSVYWNIFLVRPRAQGAGQITTPLVLNFDYIEQTGYPGRDIRLNTGKFDVLAEWHDQLLVYPANDIDAPLPSNQVLGDPYSTFREKSFSLPLNMTIKSPLSAAWIDKKFENLPYYDQISLLVYPQCQQLQTDQQNPRFFYNAHFVCVNHL
jgi:hypothetical protein